MRYYFLAEFNLVLKSRELDTKIPCDEIFYSDNFEPKEMEILPNLEDLELENYTFSFNSNYIKTFKLSLTETLIILRPKIKYSPENLNIFSFNFNGENVFIHYYIGKFGLVQIFFKDQKFQTKLNLCDSEIQHWTRQICGKHYLFIKIDQHGRNYYFIFNEETKIFEGYVCDINIKEKNLVILVADENVYGYKRVLDFDVEKGETEEYLINFDNRTICYDIDIRILFLDAIKIHDDACLKYLSSELRNITLNDLVEFFGEFDDYIFFKNYIILKKNTEITKICSFDIFNNLICDIKDF